jgi:PST family polysaccharide transporter
MSKGIDLDSKISVREIARQSVSAGSLSLVASVISIVNGLISSIILARLLSPSEFGVVGLASIYVTFIDTISTFGLNMQLIRMERIGDREIGTNFWLRMFLKLISVLITFALVPVFQSLYPDRPLLPSVTIALNFVWVLRAMYLPQVAVLKHKMQLNRFIALEVLSSIATTIAAPLLAFLGWGVWSLVVGGHFIGALVFWCGLWLHHRPWDPVLQFDRALAKRYLGFGWKIVLNKQLTYTLDQFDDFWAGSELGSEALGYYSKAFSLSRYPRALITAPVGKVFFSAYSRLQNNYSALSRAFFVANSLVLRFSGLLSVVLFTAAPELILFLLGPKWIAATSTFQWMLVYSFLDPLVISAGYLLLALGRPEIQTRISLMQVVLFVPLVIGLASGLGIDGIAIAADLMICTGIIALFYKAREFVSFSVKKMFLAPIVGLLLSGVAGWLIQDAFLSFSSVMRAVLKIAVVVLFYGAVLMVWERKRYRVIISDVNELFPGIYARIPWTKGKGR